MWRGNALTDVPRSAFVEAEAERLDELRLTATELRLEAGVACGRYRDAIPELRRLLADQPLKEELWLLLLRALDGASDAPRRWPPTTRPARSCPTSSAWIPARSCATCSAVCWQEPLDPVPSPPPDGERPGRSDPDHPQAQRHGHPAARAGLRPAPRPGPGRDRGPGPRARSPPARRDRPGRPVSDGAPGSIALGRIETEVTAGEVPAEPVPVETLADAAAR